MYRIADFIVDFKYTSKYFKKRFSDYECFDSQAEFIFECHDNELPSREVTKRKVGMDFLRTIIFHKKFAEILPVYNSLVLHSACFDVDGIGVAFAAHSGTGKTTHMNLWQKLLGDKMVVVNGDKPIVRFFDDEPDTPYAYGTPWNGKEHLGCNMRTKLQHICFIERSETNFVEPLDKETVISDMMKSVYIPSSADSVMKTMQLIDRLLSCCKLWKIHCNMEDEAAKIAYDAIFRPNGEK